MIALVTGASSGIGRHLALHFARGGFDLVLVARREAALRELAAEIAGLGRSARVMTADLASADGAIRLHDALVSEGVEIDVLVNNAGVGRQGRFDEIPLDEQLAMIQLNVTSLTALTRLLLPGMVARNRGGVLNVGSTAAFQPGPLLAVYYATKAYVLSLTEALAEELSGTELKVTCLAPGPTATGFAEEARMTGTRLFRGAGMSADDVARMGFEGWRNRKRLVIPGGANKFGTILVRLVPRSIVPRITKRLNDIER